jgi:hypothetical protein
VNAPQDQPVADQPRSGLNSSDSRGAKRGARTPGVTSISNQTRPTSLPWITGFGRVVRPSAGWECRVNALRFARWRSAGTLLVGMAGLLWWLSGEYAHRFDQNRIEEKAGFSPPSERIPKPSRAVVNNDEAALLLRPVNLEGTAVAYPEEVDGLVGADGQFRTDLSLSEMASVLRIDPQTITKRGSKNEIDSEAVLFEAVTGRLSERAKAKSRRLREIELREGWPVSAFGFEWVTVDFPFSLATLKHPNHEEQVVLDAISRSARGLKREPGATTNAVPLPSVRQGGRFRGFEFAGGYLPLEPFPDGDAEHAEINRGTDSGPGKKSHKSGGGATRH